MKYAWVESYREQFPVARLCRSVGVSRTGYYRWRDRSNSERAIANTALDVNVACLHAQSGQTHGRPRMVERLVQKGHVVGHERIRQNLLRLYVPVQIRGYLTLPCPRRELLRSPSRPLMRCFFTDGLIRTRV